GGVGASAAIIETARSGAFDMFQGQGAIAIVSLLAWGLGYFGQPHILVRFMAAESIKTIPNARRIGMSWMMLCLGGAVAVGFFGIAFFASR
ncbi:sodium:proline symporter, partial [Acinetobacter baumannii]|nr:sodium:proline symporter [Acinetobacter baumannii]